jgi:hypothetical protein
LDALIKVLNFIFEATRRIWDWSGATGMTSARKYTLKFTLKAFGCSPDQMRGGVSQVSVQPELDIAPVSHMARVGSSIWPTSPLE